MKGLNIIIVSMYTIIMYYVSHQSFLWPVGPSLSLLSHGFELYRYIFLCPLARVCVVYVVKGVASFQGLGQLMGVARDRTRARALGRSSDGRYLFFSIRFDTEEAAT